MLEMTMDDLKRDYLTSKEVIANTKVTYRQLDHWTRTGLVHPTHCTASNSNPVRVYSLPEHPITSGYKILWKKGDPETAHALELIRLVSSGVDVTLAHRLLCARRYGPTRSDRDLMWALKSAMAGL